MDLSRWDYGPLYRGWLATDVLDRPVQSLEDEALGWVSDLIISLAGRLRGMVLATAPDLQRRVPALLLIPWQSVGIRPEGGPVWVPATPPSSCPPTPAGRRARPRRASSRPAA